MNYREGYKRDFKNLEKVTRFEKTEQPVLFEFFMNDKVYSHLTGIDIAKVANEEERFATIIQAYYNAGYDYASIPSWYINIMQFPKNSDGLAETRSINEGNMISDQESFDKYPWPDPSNVNYEQLNALGKYLQDDMKLVTCGPGGLLENAIDLVGFENLCLMTMMDPELCEKTFNAIGERLLVYYTQCAKLDSIGGIICNDDWGFKNQTMLDPSIMRQWIFPWYKKIVEAIHAEGKLAILHSCGNLGEIMPDIINDMDFDAKHSYEDEIVPVEKALDLWGNDIAIVGGIDMDFLCRKPKEDIEKRVQGLLDKTMNKGGYALGSGNSIPHYVPVENYMTMILGASKK